jgi:hypothetical protein
MKQVIGRFKFSSLKAVTLAASVGLLGLGFVSSASAGVMSATATGQSLAVNLTVQAPTGAPVPIVTAVAQTNTTTVTGPPSATANNSVLAVNLANLLTTGVLNSGATVNIPAVGGPGSATGSASIANLQVFLAALGLPTTLNATLISSSAMLSKNTANMVSANGTTTLLGASINMAPVIGSQALAVNPAPNTVLLNAGGIMIVLNEQILNGSTTGNFCTPTATMTCTDTFTVNAIDISFNNAPLGLNTVNGSIILASSSATLIHMPLMGGPVVGVAEPATLLLFGMGLGGIFFLGLRRKPGQLFTA